MYAGDRPVKRAICPPSSSARVAERVAFRQRQHVLAERKRARLVHDLLHGLLLQVRGSFLWYHAVAANVWIWTAYATSLFGAGWRVW